MKAKVKAKQLVDQLSQALDAEVRPGWRRVLQGPYSEWRSTDIRVFADTDKLLELTRAARLDTHVHRALIDDGSHLARRVPDAISPYAEGGAEASRATVDFYARSTTARRLWIEGRDEGDVLRAWSIELVIGQNRRESGMTLWSRDVESEGRLNQLADLLEQHTDRVPRGVRLGRLRLVQPYPAPDAARIDHERQVARKAGWWGVLGGAISGLIGGFLSALATLSATGAG
ncbi:hypothetical protein [Isoptericola sp. BMS4]|uniref:hypothetical protein n=1 Tax=Isoptericola sp. BMS4 TaxID=2527875 RepID=UPI00141DFAD7|nr:hypothetical protein [Isoptericola sp. BMS4]